MKDLQQLVPEHIWNLPVHHLPEQDIQMGCSTLLLNNNEVPYNKPINSYKTTSNLPLRLRLAKLRRMNSHQIFISHGTQEAIDLCMKVFCEARIDNILSIAPTSPLYKRQANINNIDYREVELEEGFKLNAEHLLTACDEHTKIIFLCSPNNPTGNHLQREEVEKVIRGFQGIVVVDEAYAVFSRQPSYQRRLKLYPNLIVLDSFSMSWAAAALRLGMIYASNEIISLFEKVTNPYFIDFPVQQAAMELLESPENTDNWLKIIRSERSRMVQGIASLSICERVYPTQANFLLAKMNDANKVESYLRNHNIAVQNCSALPHCDNCLRITISSKNSNAQLLGLLRCYSSEMRG